VTAADAAHEGRAITVQLGLGHDRRAARCGVSRLIAGGADPNWSAMGGASAPGTWNGPDSLPVTGELDPAARPRRRSFTARYEARIVDEYDALPAGSTERGALVRREACAV
jgi:hypothetical protein